MRGAAGTGGAAAHLGRRPVLLHGWREGAGVAVDGWRFHIVVAKAAEEGAEEASVPLLLQAAVGLGRCQNTRQQRDRAAGEPAPMQIMCAAIKKHGTGTFTLSCLHAEQWERITGSSCVGSSSERLIKATSGACVDPASHSRCSEKNLTAW